MKSIMTLGCALALGVAWMIAPAGAQEKAKDPVEKKVDQAGDKSMKDKVKDKAEAAKESIKDTTKKAKEKTESANIKTAQKSLRDKGLDPGPIDGVMGSKTRAALSTYQKSAGLPVTGELDTATSGKLMTDMSTSATPPSTPPAPSVSPPPPAPKPAQK